MNYFGRSRFGGEAFTNTHKRCFPACCVLLVNRCLPPKIKDDQSTTYKKEAPSSSSAAFIAREHTQSDETTAGHPLRTASGQIV